MSRGERWLRALFVDGVIAPQSLPSSQVAGGTQAVQSVLVIDGKIGGVAWRGVAVVPNATARFPRARHGELGLEEGLALADAVRAAPPGAAILAVVDVPGQAFGRREEAAGLQLALAAAVDAYVTERRAGRQIFALVVGKAISGAFLAHGLQAGWIGALCDPGVEVHVMSAASVARVTRATPDEVTRVASIVPATARDIATFARFGGVDALIDVADPSAPSATEIETVVRALVDARQLDLGTRAPRERLTTVAAAETRGPALAVRERIARAWRA